MMGWYDTNPRNMINARLAYDGAGAIGRGISGVGSAMSGYAKLKYQKKRDEKDDKFKENSLQNTRDLAKLKIDLGYDTNETAKTVANTKKEAVIYKTDGSVANNIRSTLTQREVAKLGYEGKKYVADTGERNNIRSTSVSDRNNRRTTSVSASNNQRTNTTLAENSKRSVKSSKYSDDSAMQRAKIKAKAKKKGSKSPDWLKEAMKRAKSPEERERLLQEYKKLKTLDDMDI
jgi:hypothetical protein